MRKILCPTDFSKAAANAVEFAAFIAHHLQIPLTLLHVVHLPLIDTTETALVATEALEAQKQDATDKLNQICRYLSGKYTNYTCEYNTVVKEALLSDAVKQLCQTNGVDLVVVGTSGGGNSLEEILLGSNTKAVMESVSCPVLAIPIKAEVATFRHFVYASNYQEEDAAAIRHLLTFAATFKADVQIVHVSPKESDKEHSKAYQFRDYLQAQLPDAALDFHEIVHPDEVEGLKKFLSTTKADVLVLLKKHKSFWSNLFDQSLSEQMTYQTKLPLLVYHA